MQLELAEAGFLPSVVSVTECQLNPSATHPSISVRVHAGAILGGADGGILDPG